MGIFPWFPWAVGMLSTNAGIGMAVFGALLYLIGSIGVGTLFGTLIHDSESDRECERL